MRIDVIGLSAFKDNYIWLIINPIKRSISCIDPGDATPVLTYAKDNQLSLNHILLTHHHHDHINGVSELLAHFPNALVYGPLDDRIATTKRIVGSADVICIDNLTFQVLDTPGHTSSHICYYESTRGWLFCGDTLFSAGCGRVFDGTIEALHESVRALKQLPNETKLYCGHEYTRQNLQFAATIEPDNRAIHDYFLYLQNNPVLCSLPSTIAHEKEINPFMRTDTEMLQAVALASNLGSADSLSIFKYLREKKNNH